MPYLSAIDKYSWSRVSPLGLPRDMLPQAWIFPIEDHSIHIPATAARLIHDSRFTLLDDITSTVVSMIKAVSPELCKHIISQSTR